MEVEIGKDKTAKLNFGEGYSAVVIPLGGRNTLCLSTQIGCPMGCRFCMSGKKEFVRNLTVNELKGQLEAAREYLGIERKDYWGFWVWYC